jgi:hypothetical protein
VNFFTSGLRLSEQPAIAHPLCSSEQRLFPSQPLMVENKKLNSCAPSPVGWKCRPFVLQPFACAERFISVAAH